jgi:hypothetical protein
MIIEKRKQSVSVGGGYHIIPVDPRACERSQLIRVGLAARNAEEQIIFETLAVHFLKNIF